jgi:hypothetical protein
MIVGKDDAGKAKVYERVECNLGRGSGPIGEGRICPTCKLSADE